MDKGTVGDLIKALAELELPRRPPVRKLLSIYCVGLVLICTILPLRGSRFGPRFPEFVGWWPLWALPFKDYSAITVDTTLVILEVTALTAATGAVILWWKSREDKSP